MPTFAKNLNEPPMKKALLLICTSFAFMASAQVSDLQSAFPNGNTPTIFPSTKTYTTCGYLQESNAFENGRISDTQLPLICADDFIIPAGQCWNIENITANFFTNTPADASAMNIYFYADAAGTPGALVGTYIAAPSDWSTSVLGNNFSLDLNEFDVNLATPITLCGGGAGTTYWFSIQAVIPSGIFYWEFAETASPYGNNGVNAASNAGPWALGGLDNFVFELNPALVNNLTMTECDGFSITVGTNTYNTTGITQDILVSTAGCDSIVNLDLTILPAITGTDTQIACDSLVWIDAITYYVDNTTATFNLVAGASNGCDSLVTLDLTVNSSATGTDTQFACDSLVWIDAVTYYTDNNIATFNIVAGAANGCDSLVTLDLTVGASVIGTDTQIACDSLLWIDAITYYADNNTATFNIVGGSVGGCDSLVTLNLTVFNATSGIDTQVACDSLVWIDAVTYYADNNTATFNVVAGSVNGCDSLVTLDLTVITGTTGTDTQVACDSLVWIDGNTYTVDNNTATFNIVGGASNSCDSLVTLDLTVVASPNNGITVSGVTITADESGATYQWVDCNDSNSAIAGETNQSYTPTVTGDYAVEVTLNGCTSTSPCTLIDFTSIGEETSSFVSVYPNPTSSEITISVDGIFTYQVLNVLGQVIAGDTGNKVEKVDLGDFSNGVYFVKVNMNEFEQTIKVVKK
ncbi:MAG: hypothetical protein ACI857_002262 [Arenicella sp.]